jgi:hypothetical protein
MISYIFTLQPIIGPFESRTIHEQSGIASRIDDFGIPTILIDQRRTFLKDHETQDGNIITVHYIEQRYEVTHI